MAALLDINTANKAQMKSLLGIDESRAIIIINGRPYDKKDQLISKNIVPGSVYEKIKGKIIAKKR